MTLIIITLYVLGGALGWRGWVFATDDEIQNRRGWHYRLIETAAFVFWPATGALSLICLVGRVFHKQDEES